ncbi:hypothetical protein KOI35_29980 [Actinoplanes bogorensis]|uniref:Uncharacterized protein n=1 Tax=Paractinoplanes bogorensis TaxID=1610840 RepID=A0ABS5YWE1_9ACTN|nr:hypothetical protein [Actinoplanes bogorensis]MBU2667749.1 hypothetical protein [Actinoplanes bogorensis]
MKLSDLLEGAPPARYSVDDFVSAGRRRRRRRNAGWAIAAVVAVAIAIGVPQILTRHDDVLLPAYPPGAKPFDQIFSGYLSGDLRVGDPDWVSVNNQTTWIARAVPSSASLSSRPSVYESAGRLALYRPGFTPPDLWDAATVAAAEPIRGGQAYFAKPTVTAGNRADRLLVWEYADGALGVVMSYGELSRKEMVRVATAFRLSEARPARQSYAVSWVPPGLRLVAVEGGRGGSPTAVFVPARDSAGFTIDPRVDQTEMTTAGWSSPTVDSAGNVVDYAFPMPLSSPPGYTPVPPGGIAIGMTPGFTARLGRTPTCRSVIESRSWGQSPDTPATECEVAPDNDSYLVARSSPDVPIADLKRMAVSGRLTEAERTTVESFPTSAQVPSD